MALDCGSIGKLAVAKCGTGGFFAVGTVIAYCDAPTVTIKKSDGQQVAWRADLCHLLTETETAIYYATEPKGEQDK